MRVYSKVATVWSSVSNIAVKVGGSWRTVTAGYVNVGGAWRKTYSSLPVITYLGSPQYAADSTYHYLLFRYSGQITINGGPTWATVPISYTIVGGGGGGGTPSSYATSSWKVAAGGGGGGGQVLSGSSSFSSYNTLGVQVGGGGGQYGQGSPSAFAGIEAYGGSAGLDSGPLTLDNTAVGSIGGGGGLITNPPGAGLYGSPGGIATPTRYSGGGGGGGAFASGSSSTSKNGGNGGSGNTSALPQFFGITTGGGGGGGGGTYNTGTSPGAPGNGVSGQGGQGGYMIYYGPSLGYAANFASTGYMGSGNGGGGGFYYSSSIYAGAYGGSGCVVLRIPIASVASVSAG